MGSVTEGFSNLSEFLTAEHARPSESKNVSGVNPDAKRFLEFALRPWLPRGLTILPGTVFDSKDRSVGPFDAIACSETCPPFGQGDSVQFAAEGVVFCLNVRSWAQSDISAFGASASFVKKLERKRTERVFCAAVTFDNLLPNDLTEFMNGPEGQGIDAVLSIGSYLLVRNADGLYGDPSLVPYVSERGAGATLKAFQFLLLRLSTAFLGLPFPLADYQHL